MSTVGFVSYEFAGEVRRIGPVPLREAETLAKELARRPKTTKVKVEEWGPISVKDVPCPT